MLKDTITEELKQWNDKSIVDDLQKRYEAWDSGKKRAILWQTQIKILPG